MTSLTENQSKHIRELLRSASARRQSFEFVIEGPHLLEVALEKASSLFSCCAFTVKASKDHSQLLERAQSLGITTYSLPAKLAHRISATEEPQGIFAVLKIPSVRELKDDTIVALDGIQDPGNVGTIVRTAAWFGISTILLGDGTADAYSPKVVRSTQGAIFEVSVESSPHLHARLSELKRQSWQIVATSLSPTSRSIYDFNFGKKTVIVFGSEAHGISDELLKLADECVVIPRLGSGESLNVASSAAIVLSELRRRQC